MNGDRQPRGDDRPRAPARGEPGRPRAAGVAGAMPGPIPRGVARRGQRSIPKPDVGMRSGVGVYDRPAVPGRRPRILQAAAVATAIGLTMLGYLLASDA